MIRETYTIERSQQLLLRSDELIVRGCQGHKRSHEMVAQGYPVFASRAQGAHFWDADGNDYLDYLLGFGPIVLGHCDPAVNAAVRQQMEEGVIFTTAHVKEIEVAERLQALIPTAEMLGFFVGGSAATDGAVRLARAYTGRDMVLHSGYHGWHDWARPGDVGVPPTVSALTVKFAYGDLDALEDQLKHFDNHVACVFVETVQRDGPPSGFLEGCIELAHQYGALCIFDEIKTGFRVAFGGASEYFGVRPDLATYGKACCNGYPAAFVAGKRAILDSQRCRQAWLAATFHCDLLSFAALGAVIDEMQRRDGIAHQWQLGRRLKEGINRACAQHGLGYRLGGLDCMPQPTIAPADRERCLAMLRGCLARGIYLHPGHVMFLSLAHTEDDIERTIRAVEEAAAEAA